MADQSYPATDIFDVGAVSAELEAAASTAANAKELRSNVVTILKAAQTKGRAAIAEHFKHAPLDAQPLTKAYTFLTDGIVRATFDITINALHPLPNPTESERLSMVALGGYGRGEMAPFSDVDLLFLTPYKITPWAESVIESMLYVLWDLKLKVGHSSRTIKIVYAWANRISRSERRSWRHV